ncbi:MAG: RIP metalloprotease RseP [Candidatus Gastranaerophilaceae bacterium]
MSIIIMLVLLSVLILVHEIGHFITARMFGIKVDKFGFGLPIGPTLFEKKFGDLTILIHAFLLGGYVSFPDDEKDCDLPEDSPDRFLNRPIYQRAVVVSAGVAFNVICAYLIVLFAAFWWGHMPAGKYDVFVNNIQAEKTASIWKSGMQKGDKIIELNGTPITNVNSLVSIISLSKPFDGTYNKSLSKQKLKELKDLNFVFNEDEIIPEGVTIKLPQIENEFPISFDKKIEKGISKYKEGETLKLSEKQIQLRDTIQNSKKNYIVGDNKFTLTDISVAMADSYHPLNFKVERNGKLVKLKPVLADKNGKIGIQLESREVLIPTKDIVSVIKTSTKYLYDNTYYMIYGLGQIFTGKVPLKDLHGIVAITKVGGDIIEHSGMFYGLLLTAIISMDLAIVNFLPIPALDGGHIMFLIIEKIRGRKLKDETVEKIGTFFFSLLIILMVLIVVNDIIWLKN